MSVALSATAATVTFLVTTAWTPEARAVLHDSVAIELALESNSVEQQDASVVYGMATRRLNPDGTDELRDAVGWTTLDDNTVVDPRQSGVERGDPSCHMVSGRDPVPSQRRLKILRGRPGGEDDTSTTGGPELILATRWDPALGPIEHRWVRLSPGDTVQQTIVEPNHQHQRSEYLVLDTHARGRLTLRREGHGAEVCYERAEPSPK